MQPNLTIFPVNPPVYPDDGPTVARPKSVVEIGEAVDLVGGMDAALLRDALGALAKLPRADVGKQRIVLIDTEHRAFVGLDVNESAIMLAEAGIVALTDVEARRVGFHPADRIALDRFRRDGVLVADIPVESIRCAALDKAAARQKFRDFGARAPDDVVPEKTLRRQQRLAARAAANR